MWSRLNSWHLTLKNNNFRAIWNFQKTGGCYKKPCFREWSDFSSVHEVKSTSLLFTPSLDLRALQDKPERHQGYGALVSSFRFFMSRLARLRSKATREMLIRTWYELKCDVWEQHHALWGTGLRKTKKLEHFLWTPKSSIKSAFYHDQRCFM